MKVFDLYRKHQKPFTCVIPREELSYIGVEAADFYYDLASLESAMQNYPDAFFAGYFAYENQLAGLPFCLAQKPLLYPHHPMLWIRYSKWVEVHADGREVYKESAPGESLWLQPDRSSMGEYQALSKNTYEKTVLQIKDEIARGSYYQVNYTHPLRVSFSAKPWDLFEAYYKKFAAGHFAYFDLGDTQVLSFSPELFFAQDGRSIKVQPIKGTLAKDGDLDLFWKSKKEQAELYMITDLMRNDLYQVCEPESLRVAKVKALLDLGNLYHLYSQVEGSLKEDAKFSSLMQALFPAGSITGCPKIRSQEEIQKIEKYQRGIYTGNIGYIYKNKIELNVAIRTAVTYNDDIFYHVGSGIVYDSIPEKEWRECQLKAQAFKEVLDASVLQK